jgi:hypothetical protein
VTVTESATIATPLLNTCACGAALLAMASRQTQPARCAPDALGMSSSGPAFGVRADAPVQ